MNISESFKSYCDTVICFLKISESICYVVSCHAILLDMREVISTTLPSDTEGIRATKSNVLRHIIQNFYYFLLFIFQIIGMSICVLLCQSSFHFSDKQARTRDTPISDAFLIS